MRILVTILAVCLLSSSAEAQIFKRFRGEPQVSSGCPGGVCPTNQSQDLYQLHNELHGGGNWSIPRGQTIEQHLAAEHGISSGTSVSRQGPFRSYKASSYAEPAYQTSSYSAPQVIRQSAPSYGSAGSVQRQSYGSVGSSVTPIVHYGSSAVTVVQPAGVNFIPGPTETFSEVVIGTGFKAEVTKAIISARKAGAIAPRDALRLRVAMLSPAFSKNAEELAVIQMTSSGESPDSIPMNQDGTVNTAGINWEGLTKFLEKFIPLLLQMLKALGLGG